MSTTASIPALIERYRDICPTPYYLIDEARLLRNLERISELRARTGTKCVLALKCFSTWSVFGLLRGHLDGTTASSPYEARLGFETFGKEVHAYSVAFSDDDIAAVTPYATKVIFNSTAQLRRYRSHVDRAAIGLRVNPGVSHSRFDLADPARRHSRLGATDPRDIEDTIGSIDGVMFHCNCENDDLAAFTAILERIAEAYAGVLSRVSWVSLGGGIAFTNHDYRFDDFCELLAAFARRFDVQLYLEPGSAVVARSGFLVTQVLDVVRNDATVAIVDSSVEAHMLDFLVYRMEAQIEGRQAGPVECTIAGRSCLAGDVFGTYGFAQEPRVGDLIPFADAADYTMVKKNWFNGVAMPSIVVLRLDGRMDVVKTFDYEAFRSSLS